MVKSQSDPPPYPDVPIPDVSGIVIDDGAAVDNVYSEKAFRLLTEPLYASWGGPPSKDGKRRSFIATANVGLFMSPHQPPLVPDVMVSADVAFHPDILSDKRHLTYFVWEFGKGPELVIEVVSNKTGGELTTKLAKYQEWRIPYYVVWDPAHHISEVGLRAFRLEGMAYIPIQPPQMADLGLELRPWDGAYEGAESTWLRWFADGEMLPTGAERATAEAERATAEAERATAEAERATAEAERADAAEQRAAELEALLRAHGVDIDA